jgi:hypothetical protein
MKNLIAAIAMITGITCYGNSGNIRTAGDFSPANTVTTSSVKAEPIKMANLPKDARQYIKENFPAKGITYASKTKNSAGDVIYEVGITMEGKLSILQFDKKGELLNEKVAGK